MWILPDGIKIIHRSDAPAKIIFIQYGIFRPNLFIVIWEINVEKNSTKDDRVKFK